MSRTRPTPMLPMFQQWTPPPALTVHNPVQPAVLRPDLPGKLRDYQIAPTAMLCGGFLHHNTMLDASKMGAGKTYVALATALNLGREPVVVCRKAGFSTWSRCWQRHFGQDLSKLTVVNYEMIRTGRTNWGTWSRGKTASGREYERFNWHLTDNQHLIIDEAHWMAGLGTQNADMLMAAAFDKVPTQLISASVADSPIKLRAIGYALGLHKVKDFPSWLLAHGCSENRYGFVFNCDMKVSDYKRWRNGRWVEFAEGMEELLRRRSIVMGNIHRQIFGAGKGIRIRDIPGFPKHLIVPVALNFDKATKDIREAYADLQKELKSIRDRLEIRAAMKRCQKKVEMFKLPTIAAEVRELVDQGYSVPVFVNFTDTREELMRLLKTDCAVYGDQNAVERDKHIDAFQDNSQRVIILNNMAGGETISLHDLIGNHPRAPIVFPTFWAAAFLQCTGRCPRNGALSDVVTKVPFAADTIEEESFVACGRKVHNIETLNDGDLFAGIGFSV